MSPVASLKNYVTDDRRRDSYVALREWQRRSGQTVDWEQILFPDEVLAWASQQPEVAAMLRHTY
jgi:hypothetical protein